MAEPDWSGAHRGLCLFVCRLLQPFLARSPLGPPKPGDVSLVCHLSPASLQVQPPAHSHQSRVLPECVVTALVV